MEAIYKLNTREMGIDLLNSIKDAYPDQNIEIKVRQQDESDYLMSSSANREHLLNAINEETLVVFENIKQARKCADKQAANL